MNIEKETIETLSQHLAQRIKSKINNQPHMATGIEGFAFYSQTQAATSCSMCIVEPSIALVVQGAKSMTLGDQVFRYDPEHFLLTSLELPARMQVLKASNEAPYVGLVLKLDLAMVNELILQVPFNQSSAVSVDKGMTLGKNTPELLNAFSRLIDLLDDEASEPVLAPLVKREIIWRVLISEQGARLRQIVSAGSQGLRISKAIEWLKNNYTQTLVIEELAASVQMSKSTFHHHFRELTSMSPLQFQKRLRLLEARRLMLSDNLDASAAAFHVGYESPSQFSREYARLFGLSPKRDVSQQRETMA